MAITKSDVEYDVTPTRLVNALDAIGPLLYQLQHLIELGREQI